MPLGPQDMWCSSAGQPCSYARIWAGLLVSSAQLLAPCFMSADNSRPSTNTKCRNLCGSL